MFTSEMEKVAKMTLVAKAGIKKGRAKVDDLFPVELQRTYEAKHTEWATRLDVLEAAAPWILSMEAGLCSDVDAKINNFVSHFDHKEEKHAVPSVTKLIELVSKRVVSVLLVAKTKTFHDFSIKTLGTLPACQTESVKLLVQKAVTGDVADAGSMDTLSSFAGEVAAIYLPTLPADEQVMIMSKEKKTVSLSAVRLCFAPHLLRIAQYVATFMDEDFKKKSLTELHAALETSIMPACQAYAHFKRHSLMIPKEATYKSRVDAFDTYFVGAIMGIGELLCTTVQTSLKAMFAQLTAFSAHDDLKGVLPAVAKVDDFKTAGTRLFAYSEKPKAAELYVEWKKMEALLKQKQLTTDIPLGAPLYSGGGRPPYEGAFS